MKRLIIAIISILLFTAIAGCSMQEATELIRVADNTNGLVNFKVVTNKNEIMKINEIVRKIDWVDYVILTSREEDYQFWLEKEGTKDRLTNFRIWFNNKGAIIFDFKQGKYGRLNSEDANRLWSFLK